MVRSLRQEELLRLAKSKLDDSREKQRTLSQKHVEAKLLFERHSAELSAWSSLAASLTEAADRLATLRQLPHDAVIHLINTPNAQAGLSEELFHLRKRLQEATSTDDAAACALSEAREVFSALQDRSHHLHVEKMQLVAQLHDLAVHESTKIRLQSLITQKRQDVHTLESVTTALSEQVVALERQNVLHLTAVAEKDAETSRIEWETKAQTLPDEDLHDGWLSSGTRNDGSSIAACEQQIRDIHAEVERLLVDHPELRRWGEPLAVLPRLAGEVESAAIEHQTLKEQMEALHKRLSVVTSAATLQSLECQIVAMRDEISQTVSVEELRDSLLPVLRRQAATLSEELAKASDELEDIRSGSVVQRCEEVQHANACAASATLPSLARQLVALEQERVELLSAIRLWSSDELPRHKAFLDHLSCEATDLQARINRLSSSGQPLASSAAHAPFGRESSAAECENNDDAVVCVELCGRNGEVLSVVRVPQARQHAVFLSSPPTRTGSTQPVASSHVGSNAPSPTSATTPFAKAALVAVQGLPRLLYRRFVDLVRGQAIVVPGGGESLCIEV